MLRVALACLATATVLLGAGAAVPAVADDTVPTPLPHRPWFGPQFDDVGGSLRAYATALDRPVSLEGRDYLYPLTADGRRRLVAQARESVAAGAVAVVSLEPEDLPSLTARDAEAFADTVGNAADATGAVFLVRFAPGMNRPDAGWGLLPHAFVHAFRTLSGAVHGSTRAAAMVWSPGDANGYPFGATVPRTALRFLDTDHDGRLTSRDDPYGPFYPGESAVDWVGLDVVPPSPTARLDAVLQHRQPVGGTGRRKTFYSRFAGGPHKPMLLTTGRSGLPWASQVITAGRSRALLGGVLWLDGGIGVRLLGNKVHATDLTLGPVVTPQPEPAAVSGPSPAAPAAPAVPAASTAAGSSDDGDPGFLAGVLVTLAGVGIVGAVVLLVRRRRSVPTWLR